MNGLVHILDEYQFFVWSAFLATVFLTPLAIRLAHRFGVLDVPDRELKPHAKPTPYLGGTAICAAWTLALVAAMVSGACDWRVLLPVLLGGIAMSLLGLVDDVRHVRPKVRLAIGTLVIALVLLTTRTGFRLVDSVAGYLLPDLPGWLTVPLSFALAVIVVLGACNSANLIDGLDGLCSGVTAIISLAFFLLAAHLAVWDYSAEKGDPVRLVLAIAMFGAAMGFLPWNFNPARIFMGDAGSVLLGYNCGVLILLFAERGIFRWVIGALMIFALPIFDTALAMFRRWRAGRSIFEGDRSHFYDQLVQRGFTVRQTVLISYLLTVVYAALGLLVILVRTRYALVIYVAVCVATALLAWAAGLTNPEQPRPRDPSPRSGD